ncbi:MAG: hypothetical protein EHM55_22095 [Acidobacteria bacterium]|nr:MAG: hypothetical protein EHM55_22095 [Acidobacteriota bacterium]
MFARKIVHTLCGVVLLGVFATSAASAMLDTRHATYFTFSRSVQLPGVTLPAGTYVFEVSNAGSGSSLVLVRSRDRSTVHAFKLTNAIYRPASRNLEAAITFGETSAGNPPPVKAWYPESETAGREFIY